MANTIVGHYRKDEIGVLRLEEKVAKIIPSIMCTRLCELISQSRVDKSP